MRDAKNSQPWVGVEIPKHLRWGSGHKHVSGLKTTLTTHPLGPGSWDTRDTLTGLSIFLNCASTNYHCNWVKIPGTAHY